MFPEAEQLIQVLLMNAIPAKVAGGKNHNGFPGNEEGDKQNCPSCSSLIKSMKF